MKNVIVCSLLTISSLAFAQPMLDLPAQQERPVKVGPLIIDSDMTPGAPELSRAQISILRKIEIQAAVSEPVTGGGGTRGGGESVQGQLRDLVDQNVCEWRTGEQVLSSTEGLNEVLDRIYSVDWYFGLLLRNEIERLRYCFIDELGRVPTEDPEGIVGVLSLEAKQAAIRWGSEVYVSRPTWDLLSAKSKNFLVIHEAVHSFIPMDTPLRNTKLRSFVRDLSLIEGSSEIVGEALEMSLQSNGLRLNRPLTRNRTSRQVVEFLLSSHESKRDLLAQFGTEFLTKMLSKDSSLQGLKNSWSASTIESSAISFLQLSVRLKDTWILANLEASAIGLAHAKIHGQRLLELREDAELRRWVTSSPSILDLVNEELRTFRAPQPFSLMTTYEGEVKVEHVTTAYTEASAKDRRVWATVTSEILEHGPLGDLDLMNVTENGLYFWQAYHPGIVFAEIDQSSKISEENKVIARRKVIPQLLMDSEAMVRREFRTLDAEAQGRLLEIFHEKISSFPRP